jgi:hypothetical protein
LTDIPNEMKLDELIERADLHIAKLSEIHTDFSHVVREVSTSFTGTDCPDEANLTPEKLRK